MKEEEEHRAKHLQGDCGCEVVFEGEDKEKRARTRPSKGKEKQKAIADGFAYEGEYSLGGGGGVASGASWHFLNEESGQDAVRAEATSARQDWDPQAQMAAYDYVGYDIGSQSDFPLADPEQSFATPVGGYHAGTGQLMGGQFGAGMRWYSQDIPVFHPAASSCVYKSESPCQSKPLGRKAASVSTQRHSGPAIVNPIPRISAQHAIVNNGMVRPNST